MDKQLKGHKKLFFVRISVNNYIIVFDYFARPNFREEFRNFFGGNEQILRRFAKYGIFFPDCVQSSNDIYFTIFPDGKLVINLDIMADSEVSSIHISERKLLFPAYIYRLNNITQIINSFEKIEKFLLNEFKWGKKFDSYFYLHIAGDENIKFILNNSQFNPQEFLIYSLYKRPTNRLKASEDYKYPIRLLGKKDYSYLKDKYKDAIAETRIYGEPIVVYNSQINNWQINLRAYREERDDHRKYYIINTGDLYSRIHKWNQLVEQAPLFSQIIEDTNELILERNYTDEISWSKLEVFK